MRLFNRRSKMLMRGVRKKNIYIYLTGSLVRTLGMAEIPWRTVLIYDSSPSLPSRGWNHLRLPSPSMRRCYLPFLACQLRMTIPQGTREVSVEYLLMMQKVQVNHSLHSKFFQICVESVEDPSVVAAGTFIWRLHHLVSPISSRYITTNLMSWSRFPGWQCR